MKTLEYFTKSMLVGNVRNHTIVQEYIVAIFIIILSSPWLPGFNIAEKFGVTPLLGVIISITIVTIALMRIFSDTQNLKTDTIVLLTCLLAYLIVIIGAACSVLTVDQGVLCWRIAIPAMVGLFAAVYIRRQDIICIVLIFSALLWSLDVQLLVKLTHISPSIAVFQLQDHHDFRLILVSVLPLCIAGVFSSKKTVSITIYTFSTAIIFGGLFLIKSFLGIGIGIVVAAIIARRFMRSKILPAVIVIALIIVTMFSSIDVLVNPITGKFSLLLLQNRAEMLHTFVSFEYSACLSHAIGGMGLCFLTIPSISTIHGELTLSPTNQVLWSVMCLGFGAMLFWVSIVAALGHSVFTFWEKNTESALPLSCGAILLMGITDVFYGLPDRPIGTFLFTFIALAMCLSNTSAKTNKFAVNRAK